MRQTLRRAMTLLALLRMRCAVLLLGRQYVMAHFNRFANHAGTVRLLRVLGAQVGKGVFIDAGLRIQNAQDGCCANLSIGSGAYIGPDCLFDLASPIVIENQVAVSARVCIVTHADVGKRMLHQRFPRQEGPVTLRAGCWIGVGATILHGVTVGRCAVIGACSLVRSDVPDNTVAYGIPCKPVRTFPPPDAPAGNSDANS